MTTGMQETWDDVRRGNASGIVDTITRNPIPAAMVALGVGLLFMNRGAASVSNVLINSGYTGRQLLDWIIEIPMSVTFLLCHTFHNAPRFYHDQTVREAPIATGVKSGFVAAGQVRFAYDVSLCHKWLTCYRSSCTAGTMGSLVS